MPQQAAAQICLQLPDGPDRDALRAGLMAMNVVPVNLPPTGTAAGTELLERLAQNPRAQVLLDVSNPLPRITHRFDHLLKTWPQTLRGRTILTRLSAGHVSQADRSLVQSLGFVDLVASFEDPAPAAPLRRTLDGIAASMDLPPLPAEALNRYLRAVGPVPATRSPRALIRSRTGLEAEALADLLQFRLDLRDRTYHLKKYPNCFVGTEAVQWMSEHFQLAAAQVVEIGRALQTLGLLYHVAHEQGFADRPLFFRLRAPAQLPDVRPGPLLQTLRERLLVVDRNYHGKTYPACWVGQEAVDLVCSQRNLTRHESELLLHRLMQFGLFEHVVSEHGFVDGHFFYRFNARLP
jgi:hypothetical protein